MVSFDFDPDDAIIPSQVARGGINRDGGIFRELLSGDGIILVDREDTPHVGVLPPRQCREPSVDLGE